MPSLDLGPVVGPQGPQGVPGAQGQRGEQGLPGPNVVGGATATPLTGVLTGNGSVVGVASIDAAPTADSTGFAQSGGTDKAIKGRVPVYGLGKNLLDNPVFVPVDGLPVNQRGVSSYSSGYTIDRWKIVTGGTVSLSASGVTYTRTAVGNAFAQFLKPDTVAGRTVCASLLLGSGTMVRAAALIPSTPVAYTNYIDKTEENVSLTFYLNSSGFFVFQISTTDDNAAVLKAAKLELGTEQTLCHNEGTEENPVWVLNEIPDYGEELRKCQRYLHILKCTTGSWCKIGIVGAYSATVGMAFIPLPTTMRTATPNISYNGLVLQNGTGRISITGASFGGMGPNAIYIEIAATGLTTGNTYILAADTSNSGWLTISCEP